MSSTLCQMPQPCLDAWLIEPHVSKLKSTPPKSNPSESFPRYRQEHQDNSHTEKENDSRKFDTWSFVQSLTNNSHNSKELLENEKIYVHPLTKHFASTLSMKSLEMCTESLGSETGSDISESSEEYSPLSSKIESSHSRGKEFTRKPIPSRSFPPPLTTISGSDSVRVRLHREGGRLVIKAVKFAASDGYFQADRVDGRLRLCLVKNNDSVDYENNEEVDESETRAFGCHGDDVDGVDDMGVEGIRGNSGKVEGESEIGEIQRPSRCKEGGGQERMSSWGPFLKALC